MRQPIFCCFAEPPHLSKCNPGRSSSGTRGKIKSWKNERVSAIEQSPMVMICGNATLMSASHSIYLEPTNLAVLHDVQLAQPRLIKRVRRRMHNMTQPTPILPSAHRRIRQERNTNRSCFVSTSIESRIAFIASVLLISAGLHTLPSASTLTVETSTAYNLCASSKKITGTRFLARARRAASSLLSSSLPSRLSSRALASSGARRCCSSTSPSPSAARAWPLNSRWDHLRFAGVAGAGASGAPPR
jgi:hypothetical protein